MNSLLINSLYKKNTDKFILLREESKAFNAQNNGNNIIQDDIFRIMRIYAEKQETSLKTMRMPFSDDDLCAFTCVKKGIIFVVINSRLTLSKQIFAAAHELYHIVRYFSDERSSLPREGSLLTSEAMDEESCNIEDIEANAFAGLILVPSSFLQEQMEIQGIVKDDVSVDDVLSLVDIFGVPYKAMVIRLVEEKYISDSKALELMKIPAETLEKRCIRLNLAIRWLVQRDGAFDFAGLEGIIQANEELDVLPENRIKEDKSRLMEIRKIMSEQ